MEKIRVDVNSAAVEMVQLRERHGAIERRLAELERHLSLTPDEQLERARLKKEKLRAKDRLAHLATHPPSSEASSEASSETSSVTSSETPRLPA